MVNKKKKKQKFTFKEIVEQQKHTDNKQNIIIEKNADPRNRTFRWRFDSRFLNWNNSDWGWRGKLKETKFFLDNIAFNIYESYLHLKWYDIEQRKHCGYLKNLTTKQKTPLKSINEKFKKEKILGQEDNSIYNSIYHIDLNKKHRLIGFRDKNDVFWIILNDPNHTYTK